MAQQEQRVVGDKIRTVDLVGSKGLWFGLTKKSEVEKKNTKLEKDGDSRWQPLDKKGNPVKLKDFGMNIVEDINDPTVEWFVT